MQSKNPGSSQAALIFVAALSIASTFTIGGAMLNQPLPVEAAQAKTSKTADNDGLDASVRQLVNNGKWADAIKRLDELTSADDKAGRNEAWLAFAYLYTGKHDDLKALDKKVQAMSKNDSDPNAAAIVYAFALISAGNFDEAQKSLNGIKLTEKGDALLEFTRACLALKKGNAALAAEACEKVVGLVPSFAWGYRTLGFIQDKSLKNAELAQTAYEKALALAPGFKDARGLLVDLLLSRNDFDGAIEIAQEAIHLFPRDAGNYYRLAQIYQQQWRLIEALAQLKKAVQLDKTDPRFYRAMATIYRYQGKMTEAIADEQQAVDLSKDKAFELIELSALQEQNQNMTAAIDSLKTALKESPSNTIAHQKLVLLLKKDGHTDELIAEFKRAIELNPKVEPLRLSLADAYRQAGKLDDAVTQLKEAANLDQADARPHREIARIEVKRKNYQAAAKSYTRALNVSLGSHAADAGSVEDLISLGYCYANNNDYMQAETAFTTGFAMLQLGATTGLQSTVNPADILRSLSAVFLTEGRYREAAVNLETGVMPYVKDAEQKKLDQLMCSRCKALRDQNADSLKELQTSFSALDHAAQLSHMDGYVDTLIKLGKKDLVVEAVKKFSQSEVLDKYPLVLAIALLAENKGKDAREIINKIIEEKKVDQDAIAEAYVERAHVMLSEADRKAALEALQKSAEANPKDFNVFVEQGRILLSDKKNTEAQQAAQRALDLNPYCVPAHLLLGDSFMAQEKYKEAEASFAKAAELYPTSLDAHKGLLSALRKQAKTNDAQREQEIISNLSKNS